MEMHKVRMVQRVNLKPVEERQAAMEEAGFNTFLLKNRDVFLDMLTDSGVNAMSENQYAAMMQADDSYAGSETYYRLEAAIEDVFGMEYFLPTHQGRACEHIIAKTLVRPNTTVLMNYHFTTTKAHIGICGGQIEELVSATGREITSDLPFKGNFDLDRLNEAIARLGAENVSFVRIEAGTNLIGGQPVSMANMKAVSEICRAKNIPVVYDASLLADNLYFIATRETEYIGKNLKDITREIASMMDVVYFSARKLGSARGGGIMVNNKDIMLKMRELIPLYEGFLTYGGMSVREMEALAVGLYETLELDVISQTPLFVAALCNELLGKGVPVVTPPGGLGCHVDAGGFVPHIPQEQYPAGALAAAAFIASGVRGMERGTLSEQRKPDGSETLAEMELLRLAVPKRVYTLSQVKYVADRLAWLHDNKHLIGGLQFVEEPSVLRFFFGRLAPIGDWPTKLTEAFRRDFGDSL